MNERTAERNEYFFQQAINRYNQMLKKSSGHLKNMSQTELERQFITWNQAKAMRQELESLLNQKRNISFKNLDPDRTWEWIAWELNRHNKLEFLLNNKSVAKDLWSETENISLHKKVQRMLGRDEIAKQYQQRLQQGFTLSPFDPDLGKMEISHSLGMQAGLIRYSEINQNIQNIWGDYLQSCQGRDFRLNGFYESELIRRTGGYYLHQPELENYMESARIPSDHTKELYQDPRKANPILVHPDHEYQTETVMDESFNLLTYCDLMGISPLRSYIPYAEFKEAEKEAQRYVQENRGRPFNEGEVANRFSAFSGPVAVLEELGTTGIPYHVSWKKGQLWAKYQYGPNNYEINLMESNPARLGKIGNIRNNGRELYLSSNKNASSYNQRNGKKAQGISYEQSIKPAKDILDLFRFSMGKRVVRSISSPTGTHPFGYVGDSRIYEKAGSKFHTTYKGAAKSNQSGSIQRSTALRIQDTPNDDQIIYIRETNGHKQARTFSFHEESKTEYDLLPETVEREFKNILVQAREETLNSLELNSLMILAQEMYDQPETIDEKFSSVASGNLVIDRMQRNILDILSLRSNEFSSYEELLRQTPKESSNEDDDYEAMLDESLDKELNYAFDIDEFYDLPELKLPKELHVEDPQDLSRKQYTEIQRARARYVKDYLLGVPKDENRPEQVGMLEMLTGDYERRNSLKLNLAYVGKIYGATSMHRSYDFQKDLAMMAKRLDVLPDEMNQDDPDNKELAKMLASYSEQQAVSLNAWFESPEFNEKRLPEWAAKLSPKQQNFVQGIYAFTKEELIKLGALNPSISMDDKGILHWQAAFWGDEKENDNPAKTEEKIMHLNGYIGQISIPEDNGLILEPYVTDNPRYLAIGYKGYMARARSGVDVYKNPVDKTSFLGYNQYLRIYLSQTLKEDIPNLMTRSDGIYVLKRDLTNVIGEEKVNELIDLYCTKDSSTALNPVYKSNVSNITARLPLNFREIDEKNNRTAAERDAIIETKCKIVTYDAEIYALLGAGSDTMYRRHNESRLEQQNISYDEYRIHQMINTADFDLYAECGCTDLSCQDPEDRYGKLDPVYTASGSEKGKNLCLAKGAEIHPENGHIIDTNGHIVNGRGEICRMDGNTLVPLKQEELNEIPVYDMSDLKNRLPIAELPVFKNVNHNEIGRQVMSFNNMLNSISCIDQAKIAYINLGFNMEDAIIANKRICDQTYIETDGVRKKIGVGLKLDPGNGDKGTISIVGDGEADPAEIKGALRKRITQFFKDNPDVDFVMNTASVLGRQNPSMLSNGLDNHEKERQSVIMRDKDGNKYTLESCVITAPMIITDKTAEKAETLHTNPMDFGGSRSGSINTYSLFSAGCEPLIHRMFRNNTAAWNSFREMMLVQGIDISEQTTQFSDTFMAHPEEVRPVLKLEDYVHFKPVEWKTPFSVEADEKAINDAIGKCFKKYSGFLEVTEEMRSVCDQPLYPLLPDRSRPCITEEEWKNAGYAPCITYRDGNKKFFDTMEQAYSQAEMGHGGIVSWEKSNLQAVSSAYANGKVTYGMPVCKEEFRSGRFDYSGFKQNHEITRTVEKMALNQSRICGIEELSVLLDDVRRISAQRPLQGMEQQPCYVSNRLQMIHPQTQNPVPLSGYLLKSLLETEDPVCVQRNRDVNPNYLSAEDKVKFNLIEMWRNGEGILGRKLKDDEIFPEGHPLTASFRNGGKKRTRTVKETANMLENVSEPLGHFSAYLRQTLSAKAAGDLKFNYRTYQRQNSEGLSGNKNIFKEKLTMARVKNSAFAILTADPDLKVETLKINRELAKKMKIKDKDWVRAYRDPVWRYDGNMMFQAELTDDTPGVAISPVIAKRFGADFDGDKFNISVLKENEIELAVNKFGPYSHIVDLASVIDDPAMLKRIQDGYLKEVEEFNQKTGKNIQIDRYTQMYDTIYGIGSDVQVGMYYQPELKEKYDQITVDANINAVLHSAGIRSFEEFIEENKRIVADVNEFAAQAYAEGFGKTSFNFTNPQAFYQSVYDSCIKTGVKGKTDDLKYIASFLRHDIKVEDGQVIYDPKILKTSPMDDPRMVMGMELAQDSKSRLVAPAGAQSLKINALNIQRGPLMETLATNNSQNTQEAILKIKNDPERAKRTKSIINGKIQDVQAGRRAEYNPATKSWVIAPGKCDAETSIQSLYDIYTSEHGLGLKINKATFKEVMRAAVVQNPRPENGEPLYQLNVNAASRNPQNVDLLSRLSFFNSSRSRQDVMQILKTAARNKERLVDPTGNNQMLIPDNLFTQKNPVINRQMKEKISQEYDNLLKQPENKQACMEDLVEKAVQNVTNQHQNTFVDMNNKSSRIFAMSTTEPVYGSPAAAHALIQAAGKELIKEKTMEQSLQPDRQIQKQEPEQAVQYMNTLHFNADLENSYYIQYSNSSIQEKQQKQNQWNQPMNAMNPMNQTEPRKVIGNKEAQLFFENYC